MARPVDVLSIVDTSLQQNNTRHYSTLRDVHYWKRRRRRSYAF